MKNQSRFGQRMVGRRGILTKSKLVMGKERWSIGTRTRKAKRHFVDLVLLPNYTNPRKHGRNRNPTTERHPIPFYTN
jgi:hypothetical protein